MQREPLEEQDFSTWDGTPFFEGSLEEGRHVYIVKSLEQGGFTAYGALDDQPWALFVVRGTLAQLDAFVAQVEQEGAQVTYGLPPFDTNTGGDKATTTSRPGLMADTKTGSTGPSVPTEEDTSTDPQKPGGKRKRGGKK